ncbi:NUDIX hydrolase [Lysobacter lacus]|uniref:NUDIX hydrolase n=2 Tax=Cognatilysobacter lacus TaxID=1643323 RepID=A0A5D8Z549_9GAMM|nr:NUDIX hydrolase [Lysobacter lacus]TZF90048.1 NUDIX hydrolase [Lysobacter lacus]
MHESADPIGRLRSDLDGYAARWPDEAETVAHFGELLAALDTRPFTRERLAGHFTGSAWLVDRGGTRVLLTHHRKLGRWLQLGGHADGDPDLSRVALKEAEEESGLDDLTLEPGLFDLDRHWIPARGDTPAHWHYDVRYVVRAGGNEAFVVSDESLALAWREVHELLHEPASDDSVRRMSRKWLERHSPGG